MLAFPQNVLVQVLQYVPLSQRLSSCALVSKAWYEAAAVATSSMHLQWKAGGWDPQEYLPWLHKHGQHVQYFYCLDDWEVYPNKCVLCELPCSKLCDLSLEDCAMQLGPSTKHTGILQAATGLTSLVLTMQDEQDFVGGLQSLTALHALPALQHLDLSIGYEYSAPDYEHGPYDIIPSEVLGGLTSLTYLELRARLTVESLQPFSCLTRLQNLMLHLDYPIPDSAAAIEQGQQPFKQLQQLTYLHFAVPECELYSTASSPAFGGCSALVALDFQRVLVDASFLRGLTQLRHLWLSSGDIIKGGPLGVAAALSHMSHMPRLRAFHIHNVQHVAPVASTYAALTGSSDLTRLDLYGWSLPVAAWQYMFPAGRQLPCLKDLVLEDVRLDGLLLSQHLDMLVRCCTALRHLSMRSACFDIGASLAPLLSLQHLTYLSLSYLTKGVLQQDDQGVRVLAQLTKLSQLKMSNSSFCALALLQLTALTKLDTLHVNIDAALASCGPLLENAQLPQAIQLHIGYGAAPDVWYKVLVRCAASPDCHDTLQQQLAHIRQELEAAGHGTAAFDAAFAVGKARWRVQEAEATLAQARAAVTETEQQLRQFWEQDTSLQ